MPEFIEKPSIGPGAIGQRKVGFGMTSGGLRGAPVAVQVARQQANGCRKLLRLCRLTQKISLARRHHLRNSADPAGDNRDTHRHAFHKDVGPPIQTGTNHYRVATRQIHSRRNKSQEMDL